jgi:hypothetical protein
MTALSLLDAQEEEQEPQCIELCLVGDSGSHCVVGLGCTGDRGLSGGHHRSMQGRRGPRTAPTMGATGRARDELDHHILLYSTPCY